MGWQRDGGVADPGKNYCLGSRRRIRLSKEQTIPEQLRFRKTEKCGWETEELYGLQSRKVTENRKKPWERSRLGCFICIRKCVSRGWLQEKHTGRKIETQIQKYLSEHGIAAEQIILQPASI